MTTQSHARMEAQFAQMCMFGLHHRHTRRGPTRVLEAVFKRLVARLAPPMILEVGAHEAGFSTTMRGVLPDANIIAFEGNPDVFNLHAERVKAAGVDFRNFAVADRAGTLTFGVPRLQGTPKTTHGGILARRDAESIDTFEVEAVRLDDVVPAMPCAMWIDVEGAMGQVLAGAQNTLRHTLAIFAELDTGYNFESSAQAGDIVSELEAAGFTALARDVQGGMHFNGLFVHKSIAGTRPCVVATEKFYEGIRELAGLSAPVVAKVAAPVA